jgi:hypothetical protein
MVLSFHQNHQLKAGVGENLDFVGYSNFYSSRFGHFLPPIYFQNVDAAEGDDSDGKGPEFARSTNQA